jgi:hypothetical protein
LQNENWQAARAKNKFIEQMLTGANTYKLFARTEPRKCEPLKDGEMWISQQKDLESARCKPMYRRSNPAEVNENKYPQFLVFELTAVRRVRPELPRDGVNKSDWHNEYRTGNVDFKPIEEITRTVGNQILKTPGDLFTQLALGRHMSNVKYNEDEILQFAKTLYRQNFKLPTDPGTSRKVGKEELRKIHFIPASAITHGN